MKTQQVDVELTKLSVLLHYHNLPTIQISYPHLAHMHRLFFALRIDCWFEAGNIFCCLYPLFLELNFILFIIISHLILWWSNARQQQGNCYCYYYFHSWNIMNETPWLVALLLYQRKEIFLIIIAHRNWVLSNHYHLLCDRIQFSNGNNIRTVYSYKFFFR